MWCVAWFVFRQIEDNDAWWDDRLHLIWLRRRWQQWYWHRRRRRLASFRFSIYRTYAKRFIAFRTAARRLTSSRAVRTICIVIVYEIFVCAFVAAMRAMNAQTFVQDRLKRYSKFFGK